MRILVTGGSGFVGGHVVRRLLAEQHTVVAPARKESACERLRTLGATSQVLDYADAAVIEHAMAACDAVVHVAAHLKMWGGWTEFEASNVTLTQQVLRGAQACGVRRFVHVSAASVIMHEAQPITEADESARLTTLRWLPYSATKALAEELVLGAHSSTFKTVALRPPFIWGPGDAVDGDLGRQVSKGQFAWIERGDYPFATCHVHNLCRAIELALRSDVTGACFVTDGPEISLREFMTQRLQASGLEVPSISVPAPVAWYFGWAMERLWATGWLAGDPPLTREMVRLIGYPFSLDTRRAHAELGYRPEITVEQGMRQCSR